MEKCSDVTAMPTRNIERTSDAQCIYFDDLMYRMRVTSDQLSSRTGITGGTIRQYRRGAVEPSASAARVIAHALGVTVDELRFRRERFGEGARPATVGSSAAH